MSDSPNPPAAPASLFGTIPYDDDEASMIQGLLQRYLHKDEIKIRAGPGGSKLSYLEITRAVELSNWIFKFDGWSSQIQDLTHDYTEEKNGKWSCGFSAIVRVTLKNGSFHEDVGYGASTNMGDRSMAFDKAKKEAVSDGLKRALRLFGNGLGNCLSDKDFLAQLSKGLNRSDKLDLSSERPNKRIKTESAPIVNFQSEQKEQNGQSPTRPWPSSNNSNSNNNNNNNGNNNNNNPVNNNGHSGTQNNLPHSNGPIKPQMNFPLPNPQPSAPNRDHTTVPPPPPPSIIQSNAANVRSPINQTYPPANFSNPNNNTNPLPYTPSNSYSAAVANVNANVNNSNAANRYQKSSTAIQNAGNPYIQNQSNNFNPTTNQTPAQIPPQQPSSAKWAKAVKQEPNIASNTNSTNYPARSPLNNITNNSNIRSNAPTTNPFASSTPSPHQHQSSPQPISSSSLPSPSPYQKLQSSPPVSQSLPVSSTVQSAPVAPTGPDLSFPVISQNLQSALDSPSKYGGDLNENDYDSAFSLVDGAQ